MMDQKGKFGRTIGCGGSYLEFIFYDFKVFRPHATIHDAAGAVRSNSRKGLDNCYLIGRGLISCLLGHRFGLFFYLHVELLLPSVFNSVDFEPVCHEFY